MQISCSGLKHEQHEVDLNLRITSAIDWHIIQQQSCSKTFLNYYSYIQQSTGVRTFCTVIPGASVTRSLIYSAHWEDGSYWNRWNVASIRSFSDGGLSLSFRTCRFSLALNHRGWSSRLTAPRWLRRLWGVSTLPGLKHTFAVVFKTFLFRHESRALKRSPTSNQTRDQNWIWKNGANLQALD